MNRRTAMFFKDNIAIEYSIIGEGTPVLVMHGGHSNCYEEFGYNALVEQGFSIITPSRAGYGNTSKEIGEDLSTACRYYLQLLNELKITKVHVLAVSAGGPTGLYFASKYPDRVKSIILQCAVTKRWLTTEDKEYKAAQILFHPSREKFTWKLLSFINNKFPFYMFKQMFSSFSTLTYSEVKDRMKEEDIKEIRKMNNRQRSGHGFLIDLRQTDAISVKELQAISCPALIMHSKYDRAVSIEHAYHAHQNIPLSELHILESWGHLIWLGKTAEKTDKKVVKFLKENSGLS